MSRGQSVTKRRINPDPIYQNARINKFIHYVMRNGKKDLAQKIVYVALANAAQQMHTEPVELFEKAISSVWPEQEVRPRRVGGSTYQIPIPVPKVRADYLAMNWIIGASRSRKGQSMTQKLTQELVNAYQGQGEAVKKKEDIHKMAEANRAFAHFRW